MNSPIVFTIALLIAALIPIDGQAERKDRTGFFTNLEFHQESGDLLGFELYIAVIPKGYTGAIYECEGGCSPAQVIKPVFEGDNITFEYIYPVNIKMVFKGIVDQDGITGGFYIPGYDSVPDLRLSRKKSYWNN